MTKENNEKLMFEINEYVIAYNVEREVKEQLENLFPSYHREIPDEIVAEIVDDVLETSDFKNGTWNNSDVSLAIQRTIINHLGK